MTAWPLAKWVEEWDSDPGIRLAGRGYVSLMPYARMCATVHGLLGKAKRLAGNQPSAAAGACRRAVDEPLAVLDPLLGELIAYELDMQAETPG